MRILAELFRDPRAGYAELGPHVGLSPNAIAARVKRLGSTGVLQGFAALPAPRLLGMVEGLLVFTNVDDLPEREAEILASLPDVPGVRYVDVGLDHSVQVWMWHTNEADWERIERAAVSLVGKPPQFALRGDPGAEGALLSSSEWRIMRAMLPDARIPLKELARRAGLSFKTARRHLTRLLRDGAIRMEPVLSPTEAQGLVLFTLSIVLRPDARLDEVLALLPDASMAQSTPGSPVVLLHVARDSLRDAQADHRAVSASPAVERVLFTIATRRRADAWLDDAIGARIAALRQPNVAPVAVTVPLPKSS